MQSRTLLSARSKRTLADSQLGHEILPVAPLA
jgi:hypothetical protein